MASRASVRRRRRFLVLTAFVVISLAILFVRDVLTAAHESEVNRNSLNRSFAVLANANIDEQNDIDRTTVELVTHARSMTRTEFATTMKNLSQRMDRVAESAAVLTSPTTAHGVSERFVLLTNIRVSAWRTLRDALQRPLQLTDGTAPTSGEVRSALAEIRSSNDQWRHLRLQLKNEPGHRVLHRSSWTSGTLSEQSLSSVVTLTNLRPFSAVAIGAIAIDPQPLPSRSAQIVLLPKTEVGIGVTVRNVGRSTASVAVSISTRWRRGAPTSMVLRRTIPAGTATAVIFPAVPTYPGMRGNLTVRVTGAAPAWRGAAIREYTVKVAPSD